MGFSITRELVELHGGTIVAESEGVGKGAIFIINLPAARQRKRTSVSRRTAANASKQTVMLLRSKILIVEDDPETASGITQLLKKAGADVTHCLTAADALNALEIGQFDLLLSDISLPEIDGVSFLREWRTREKNAGRPELVALALTAFAQVSDQAAARAPGFNAMSPSRLNPTCY